MNKKSITAKELADEMDYSIRYVNSILSGTKKANDSEITPLAKFLNTTKSRLISERK